MLYREIIAFCSQIHTKHTNTLCGQNVELLNVKTTVLYRVNKCASCRQHIGHVCELYSLRYYTLLVLVWWSWLFVQGSQQVLGAAQEHRGGDPSAWGDRKASILNVTTPSNVCWHRRFRRTCCLIWQYVAPDCRRWIYLRHANPKVLVFVGIVPRIGMEIHRRFGNHRFKSEWIWGWGAICRES
jgi:hypothetical protein